MARRTLLVALAASAAVVSSGFAAGSPKELPKLATRSPSHNVVPRGANPRPLRVGTYKASLFPLPLQVSVPTGWRGGQGRSRQGRGRKKFRGTYGWIVLCQGSSTRTRGAITVVTAYGRTPSLAAVVRSLRTRGRGATYEATTPVKVAGYSGSQFDGRVDGRSHVFVPFSPRLRQAVFYPDAFEFDKGEVFRIIALNVRGKTVVIFIENAALPPDQFPSFVTAANQILASLRFPASRGRASVAP